MVTIKVGNETISMSEREFDLLLTLFGLVKDVKKKDGYKHVIRAHGTDVISLEYCNGDYFLEVGDVKETV